MNLGRNIRILTVLAITAGLLPPAAPAAAVPSFEAAVSGVRTPQQLVRLMKDRFEFAEDIEIFGVADYWQEPKAFWDRGRGDCEDFAVFARHVLRLAGYETWVVSFYGPNGFAHTVTVYVDDGRYNVINENRLYRYRAETIEEALTRITPFWTWGAFARREGTRGWVEQRITNPSPAPAGRLDPFLCA